MSDTSKRKPKLTLKDLQSVSLGDAEPGPASEPESAASFLASLAASPPSSPAVVPAASAEPDSADAPRPAASAPSLRPRMDSGLQLDAAEYLPEGVSSDVASLLGRPTKQQAETNAFRKLAEQVAAAEAAAADERRRREEAESRDRQLAADREALQRQIAETARLEQQRAAALRRRNRLIGGGVAAVVVALIGTVAVLFALRPPPLDPNIYAMRDVPVRTTLVSGESVVRFDPIPDPPEPEVAPEPVRRPSTGTRPAVRRPAAGGRDTVRGRDLF